MGPDMFLPPSEGGGRTEALREAVGRSVDPGQDVGLGQIVLVASTSLIGADLAQTSMFRSFSGRRPRSAAGSAGRVSVFVISGVTADSFASRNPGAVATLRLWEPCRPPSAGQGQKQFGRGGAGTGWDGGMLTDLSQDGRGSFVDSLVASVPIRVTK